MSAAQEKFEKERETILKSLPQNIHDSFGTMGFCKHEEEDADSDDDDEKKAPAATTTTTTTTTGEGGVHMFVPCLILSPYDVPPRPVRDVYWHNLYMDRSGRDRV